MTMTLSGSGTIAGLTPGGLPDASVITSDLADANVTPQKLTQPLTQGTAVVATSGNAIDFTGIPSWAKRITIMLYGISTTGANDLIIQVGNGSIVTTGYQVQRSYISTSTANAAGSFNFCIATLPTGTAADTKMAQIVLTNVTGNIWVSTSNSATINSVSGYSAGGITLSSALDRIRLSTNSADTFDAGTINILYEG